MEYQILNFEEKKTNQIIDELNDLIANEKVDDFVRVGVELMCILDEKGEDYLVKNLAPFSNEFITHLITPFVSDDDFNEIFGGVNVLFQRIQSTDPVILHDMKILSNDFFKKVSDEFARMSSGQYKPFNTLEEALAEKHPLHSVYEVTMKRRDEIKTILTTCYHVPNKQFELNIPNYFQIWNRLSYKKIA